MQAANPSHALALVVVDELHRCGVTDVVLAPGSRSAALAMAFHDDPRIRLHVEIDERSAGFLAVGLGRATGRPAAVVVTSGSAVANLHPAVVEADTGRVPLVLLTADRPPELQHTGANQTIDQIGIFASAPRWAVELGPAEDHPAAVAHWRATVCRAVAEARGLSSMPGPVHVDLPFREPTVPLSDDGRNRAASWRRPLDGRPGGRPWLDVSRPRRRLDPQEVGALARRLASVERGLIVVGATGAAAGPVHALSRALRWPVLAEPHSGARTSPATITCGHHLLADPAFAARNTPELVLRIGRSGLSRAVAATLPPQVPQILLDGDGSWWDPERTVAELVAADVETTCTALAGRVGRRGHSVWWAHWREAERRARAAVDAVLDTDDAPTEPRTARDVAAAVPSGGTLVVSSSMPARDLDLTMRPREDLRVVANRGASGIDGFVSTALGVAIGTGAPTVGLCGDLSLLHDGNGFLLAPEGELGAVFVVVDNNGGGIFSFLPQARFPAALERVFATPHGRDLERFARFHDLAYTAVTSARALPALLGTALGEGGLHLLHVRTERGHNRALHGRLSAAVGAALTALH